MPRHLRGGKYTGSHTTVTDAAERVARFAHKIDAVSKIAFGIIRSAGGGTFGMKFKPVNGGWEVVVRGNTCIQTIYIYTRDPNAVKSALEKEFAR